MYVTYFDEVKAQTRVRIATGWEGSASRWKTLPKLRVS
jgi:hypothetical protein